MPNFGQTGAENRNIATSKKEIKDVRRIRPSQFELRARHIAGVPDAVRGVPNLIRRRGLDAGQATPECGQLLRRSPSTEQLVEFVGSRCGCRNALLGLDQRTCRVFNTVDGSRVVHYGGLRRAWMPPLISSYH